MKPSKQVKSDPARPNPFQDVRKLRRIFIGSILLCVLIVLHLFVYMRIPARTSVIAQISLLCILMWALVVTYYAFNALAEMERKARAMMKDLLRRDGVTGAFTVDYLHKAIEQKHELILDSEHEVAVGYIHISGLDHVNKEFGYATGNVVVHALAKMIADALPHTGFLGRLGGAEFVAFMPQTTPETAHETMEQMREAIRAYSLVLGTRGVIEGLDAQVGVTAYAKGTKSLDDLVREARGPLGAE